MVKLKKIAIMPVAKIFTILHAAIGLILGLIVAIGSITGQEDEGIWTLGAWSLVVFPIVNAALGFVTGSFLAGSYNLISRWLGAIEFDIEEEGKSCLKNL